MALMDITSNVYVSQKLSFQHSVAKRDGQKQ